MAVTVTNQAHTRSGLAINNHLYHERYDDNRNLGAILPAPAAPAVDARGVGAERGQGSAADGEPVALPANSQLQVAPVAADTPSFPLCAADSLPPESEPASAEGARPAFAAGVGSHSFSGPTAAGALGSPSPAAPVEAGATLAQQLIAQLVAAVSETKQVGAKLLVPPVRDAVPLPDTEQGHTPSAKLDDEAKLPDKYHDRDNPLTAQTTGTASDAATLLDSVWGEAQGPFEGPEKLLELWFADSPDALALPPGQGESGKHGLKAVPREVWEQMLDLVHCKVLSVIPSVEVDAYLLSESSMFVFPHKLILKTCGTTTLLLGLERLLEIAAAALAPHFVALKMHTPLSVAALAGGTAPKESYAPEAPSMLGSEKGEPVPDLHKLALGRLVQRCFYSRKSFMFPELQKGPHKDWMTEVAALAAFFGPKGGAAYTVGKMNGDHWLLYTSQSPESFASDEKVRQALAAASGGQVMGPADQTLEMLMTHLSPRACSNFVYDEDTSLPEGGDEAHRGHALGGKTAQKLGLDTLYAETHLDAYAFDPCGFSANAVVARPCATKGSVQDGYWTIHVTPEEDFSYASFETNVVPSCGDGVNAGSSPSNAKALIQRVVDIFEPGRLTITLFASADLDGGQGEVLPRLQLEGYRRTDRILYEFCHYDLYFVQFERLVA